MEAAREDGVEDVGALKQPGQAEATAPAGEGEDLEGPELTGEHPPVRRSRFSNTLLIRLTNIRPSFPGVLLGVGICYFLTDSRQPHRIIATPCMIL